MLEKYLKVHFVSVVQRMDELENTFFIVFRVETLDPLCMWNEGESATGKKIN